MTYYFIISYPISVNLEKSEQILMQSFPQHTFVQNQSDSKYHNNLYSTNNPQDIINVARALQHISSMFFISCIMNNGDAIYYSPAKVSALNTNTKTVYMNRLSHLPQTERTIHDYLVNIYKNVPL